VNFTNERLCCRTWVLLTRCASYFKVPIIFLNLSNTHMNKPAYPDTADMNTRYVNKKKNILKSNQK